MSIMELSTSHSDLGRAHKSKRTLKWDYVQENFDEQKAINSGKKRKSGWESKERKALTK